MISLLANHIDTLKAVFDSFSDVVENIQIVKLTTSTNNGVFRMLEGFEVIPTYLSKVEVKVLFSLIVHAQVRVLLLLLCMFDLKVI